VTTELSAVKYFAICSLQVKVIWKANIVEFLD
jgi:hypothetical protein